jgi:hypothetical protein
MNVSVLSDENSQMTVKIIRYKHEGVSPPLKSTNNMAVMSVHNMYAYIQTGLDITELCG